MLEDNKHRGVNNAIELTASSIVVTDSSHKDSIASGGRSGTRQSSSSGPCTTTPALRRISKVLGARFGFDASSSDIVCVKMRYRSISTLGFPVMANSTSVLFAEVRTLSIRPVVESRFTATGQACVSTSHLRSDRDPPRTAQWTGNLKTTHKTI